MIHMIQHNSIVSHSFAFVFQCFSCMEFLQVVALTKKLEARAHVVPAAGAQLSCVLGLCRS